MNLLYISVDILQIYLYILWEKSITSMQDVTRENKLRLLMILAAIYPEKFQGEKGQNIMKVGI